MKKVGKIASDSDDVYDLGKRKPIYYKHRYSTVHTIKNHIIVDTHDGFILMWCPRDKHQYKHIMNVPNKFALVCRGCSEDI